MTSVTISLKENNIQKYNLAMSAIDPVIKKLATHFNGSAEMGAFIAPGKPTLRADFNTEADADAFIKEVQVGEKFLAKKKFPGFNIQKN